MNNSFENDDPVQVTDLDLSEAYQKRRISSKINSMRHVMKTPWIVYTASLVFCSFSSSF